MNPVSDACYFMVMLRWIW